VPTGDGAHRALPVTIAAPAVGRPTKGRLGGKEPKLNARQEAHLVALFEVGRSTVYRAMERNKSATA
jgi:hypothetical protein